MKDYNSNRKKVLDTINRVYNLALTTTSGGNISMYDGEDIYITPSGVDKGTLKIEDIMVVKANGEMIGKHTPSMELPFHSNTFKARTEVFGIVHAHAPAVVAYATARVLPDAKCVNFYKKYIPNINTSRYALPGSLVLGDIIKEEFIKGADLVMMDNHGATACGKDLKDAFNKYEALDFLCSTLINASLIGAVKKANFEVIQHKFDIADISIDEEITKAIEEIKAFATRSYKNKMVSATFGTFATRINDGFVINADLGDRNNLCNDDFIVYKNGKINKQIECDYLFAVEQIFANKADINNIFISMPSAIMAFAVTNKEFDSRLIPESYIMLRDVKNVDGGSLINANSTLLNTLDVKTPVIIANNEAIIATGTNMTKTFDRMEVIEYSARSVIMAKNINKITPINEKEVEEINKRFLS